MRRIAEKLQGWQGVLLPLYLVLTLAGLYYTAQVQPEFQAESMLRPGDPALEALARYDAVFPSVESRFLVGLALPAPFDQGGEQSLEELAAAIREVPGVDRVVTPRSAVGGGDPARSRSLQGLLLSADRRTAALVAFFDKQTWAASHQDRAFSAVERILEERCAQGAFAIVGEPFYRREYVRCLGRDQATFIPVSLAILLGLLAVVFRRPLWVGLPFLAVGLTLAWTGGLLGLLGRPLTMLTGALPTLLIAIGVAVSIHVVFQFREELGRGRPPRETALNTVVRVALPCLLSTLTTMVGFGSLLYARIPDIQEFGVIAALGTGFSLLITMVVLPAALGRSRPPARAPQNRWLEGALSACDRLAARRPRTVLAGAGLVLAAAGFGAARVDMDAYLTDDMGARTFIFRSYEFFAERLSSVIPLDLILEAQKPGALVEPEGREALARLQRFAARQPFVDKTLSLLDVLEDLETFQPLLAAIARKGGRAGALQVVRALNEAGPIGALTDKQVRMARVFCLARDVGARRSFRFYDELQEFARTELPPGYRVTPAGISVLVNHVVTAVVAEGTRSFLFAFAIIFVAVVLLFRSLAAGLLSLAGTLLPVFVGLGAMGLLGIVIRTSTILVGTISLGLAIDLSIHLQARYFRERREGRSGPEAVSAAMAHTGQPILVTALILVLGFGTLTLSSFGMTSEFGLIAAVTIGAALLTSLFVLPALLHLGHRRGGRAAAVPGREAPGIPGPGTRPPAPRPRLRP